MSFRDDEEDLFISPSGEDSLVSRQKAEQKARESKARQKGKLLNLQKQILSGQISAAQADEETKRLKKESEDEPSTFGTKTLKESEEQEILTGNTELSTDDLVEENEKEAKRTEMQDQEIHDNKA